MVQAHVPQVMGFSAATPVSVNESWTKRIATPVLDHSFLAVNTWTLSEVGDDHLGLELASNLSPYTLESAGEASLAQEYQRYVALMEGRQTGRLTLNRGTGWPRSIRLKQKYSGTSTAHYRGRRIPDPQATVRLRVECSVTLEPDVARPDERAGHAAPSGTPKASGFVGSTLSYVMTVLCSALLFAAGLLLVRNSRRSRRRGE